VFAANSGMSAIKNVHFNAILEAMRNHRCFAISEIAGATGLSIPTVKKAIDFGVNAGVVVPSDIAPSTGGRKAQLYKINSAFCHTLYFLLDNEELHFVLKDYADAVSEKAVRTIALPAFRKEIEAIFNALNKKYKNISAVCIAVPAITDSGKIIDWYYNPSLNGFDLKEYFENKYKVNVAVENDMKLTALAAAEYSSNKEDTTLATLQFGHNGIGLGQIVNGKILRGANGFAGEISFLRGSPEDTVSIEYCAKIVRSAIVFTNPELIGFYTSKSHSQIDVIMREAVKGFPAYAIPKVIISDDYLEDMLKGLEIISKSSREINWA